MIVLHRLNGSELVINANVIETVEGNPDTVIMLTNERRYVVKEPVKEVIEKVIAFHRNIAGKTGAYE
jgi:flagellar protein FlbD